MKDYRPISCCNVLYKVISKIIANRLKKILLDLIALNQSAFVKDRLLVENLLLATELVKDYHKDSISSRCAIKIDISKAFDSVQWSFIINTLSAMNLPAKFIHWILLCITTANFSVQVNGELAGFFRSERGLRQGCSLSPYLFVISMNILSKLLDKAACDREIGYHPRCKIIGLTHLSFADDIMVLTDGQARSVDGIIKVFDEFARISGLKISLEKSTIFFSGVSAQVREDMALRFPFTAGQLPVRYLGLPLLTKCMSSNDYLPLIEKIRKKFTSWTARFLSFAGRLQLIASVIQSLTNLWLSAFRLPFECLKEIERLCSAFLWSGPTLNSHKAKISWHEICQPKREGGLGLRPLKEVNAVSCLKMVWRILSSKNSLWVNWIKAYLLRHGSFWTIQLTTSTGSWMWRKLLKYRDKAKAFFKMDVRNGERTSFWFDTWSPLGPLIDVTGERGFIDMGISRHATVAQALATRRRRQHHSSNLNQIEHLLHTYQARGSVISADIPLWKQTGDEYKSYFQSKKTWMLIRKNGVENNWHGGIWFRHFTPKYAFCAWLAIHNRLSTADRMQAWNNGMNTACILCQDPMETRDHLFFSCGYSAEIWSALTKGLLKRRHSTSWTSILSVISDTSQDSTTLLLVRYVFQATLHSIWRERNSRRHGEKPTPPHQLI